MARRHLTTIVLKNIVSPFHHPFFCCETDKDTKFQNFPSGFKVEFHFRSSSHRSLTRMDASEDEASDNEAGQEHAE
jgi:hypothetical protein